MKLALEQANVSLKEGEVPVGCVFVYSPSGPGAKDKPVPGVIAASHNMTNVSKNATTHCEINCIREMATRFGGGTGPGKGTQKLLEITRECTLYVTCEPCLMCAHALNQVQLKRVVFGCSNDKFGGNG